MNANNVYLFWLPENPDWWLNTTPFEDIGAPYRTNLGGEILTQWYDATTGLPISGAGFTGSPS